MSEPTMSKKPEVLLSKMSNSLSHSYRENRRFEINTRIMCMSSEVDQYVGLKSSVLHPSRNNMHY
jgi:hypothetical protein